MDGGSCDVIRQRMEKEVQYDCEIQSFMLRKTIKIRGEQDENGEWRKLLRMGKTLQLETHSLYRPLNSIRVTKSRVFGWTGHVIAIGNSCSIVFRIFTGKPTGKRTIGRRKCRKEDNIRMDLKKTGVEVRN